MPGYAIKSEGLGAFYGVKYIPSTGRLTVEKINDGVTPVRLPDSRSETIEKITIQTIDSVQTILGINDRPVGRRADDYRDWLFTTNRLTFSWDSTNKSNLVVEVR